MIRAFSGDPRPVSPLRRAHLDRDVKHTPGRTEFVRARMREEAGELVVTPIVGQSSGSIPSIAWADALVVVPKSSEGIAAGKIVDVLVLA